MCDKFAGLYERLSWIFRPTRALHIPIGFSNQRLASKKWSLVYRHFLLTLSHWPNLSNRLGSACTRCLFSVSSFLHKLQDFSFISLLCASKAYHKWNDLNSVEEKNAFDPKRQNVPRTWVEHFMPKALNFFLFFFDIQKVFARKIVQFHQTRSNINLMIFI